MPAKVDWNQLGSLPRVARWNKGKPAPSWEQYAERCESLAKAPLIITAEMASPVVHADACGTHLDAVLSWAALTLHPVASQFDAPPVIPLPLALAWVDTAGRPLWCCTPLRSHDPAINSREYWHKRYPGHRADFGSKVSADTKTGRWKEYRVPLHAESSRRLMAICIGHADEVERLLSAVSHIGKKASAGYGRVAGWSITPAAHDADEILTMRPVPVEYFAGRSQVGVLEPLRAWTPPYWYAPFWRPCMVPA